MYFGNVVDVAKEEIAAEKFRKLVDAEKLKLQNKKPWWYGIFPFVISISRRK